jgi:hypothetical protein
MNEQPAHPTMLAERLARTERKLAEVTGERDALADEIRRLRGVRLGGAGGSDAWTALVDPSAVPDRYDLPENRCESTGCVREDRDRKLAAFQTAYGQNLRVLAEERSAHDWLRERLRELADDMRNSAEWREARSEPDYATGLRDAAGRLDRIVVEVVAESETGGNESATQEVQDGRPQGTTT